VAELVRFKSRIHAGELLAQRLGAYAGRSDVVVLALPRGGVPVGNAIAKALGAPLDILLVRKLGVPGHEEYAMGAVGSGGLCVLQPAVIEALRIPKRVVQAMARRKLHEIAWREKLYRADRPALDVHDHVVILVDDGLATGSTMLTAVHVLREGKPARIVIAVPAAAPDICQSMRPQVDEMICLHTPEPFYSVGLWYEDFKQTSDEEVMALLDDASRGNHAGTSLPSHANPDGTQAQRQES
jgi:putative phosphoribosyl transferase